MLFYSCSTVPLQKGKRFQKWLCSWPQGSLTALGMERVCLTEILKKTLGAMKQEGKYERNQAYFVAHTLKIQFWKISTKAYFCIAFLLSLVGVTV